jgi:hypothetical protein
MLFIAFIAALGGMLAGYDTGVMAGFNLYQKGVYSDYIEQFV